MLHAHKKRKLLTKLNKDDDNDDAHNDNMMVMISPRFHLGLILPENKVDLLSTYNKLGESILEQALPLLTAHYLNQSENVTSQWHYHYHFHHHAKEIH